jgi:flagellar hook assembly protein FlgD
MNKYKFILLALALVLIIQSAMATPLPAESVRLKNKTTFVYKADKDFMGATIEIRYQNGDLVSTEKLEKRRIVIDFAQVKSGEYTIRITKGKRVEEFFFEKS